MIAELLNIDLVKELKLDSLPSDKKESLMSQMSEVVENRINMEVISILSEDDKKELDKVLDSNGDLIQFLKNKIPNFELLVAEVVANFKKEILNLHQAVTEEK